MSETTQKDKLEPEPEPEPKPEPERKANMWQWLRPAYPSATRSVMCTRRLRALALSGLAWFAR